MSCGVHTSSRALEADIRAWIDTWNEEPRHFAWTKNPPVVDTRRDQPHAHDLEPVRILANGVIYGHRHGLPLVPGGGVPVHTSRARCIASAYPPPRP
jgi:hypothetical protein